MLVERRPNALAVNHLYPAYYVCAEGELAGSEEDELALYAAFERGGVEFVKSIYLNETVDPARCWFWSPRFALGYDAPAE